MVATTGSGCLDLLDADADADVAIADAARRYPNERRCYVDDVRGRLLRGPG